MKNRIISLAVVAVLVISALFGMNVIANTGEMSAAADSFGGGKITVTFSEEPVSNIDFSGVYLINTNEKADGGADALVVTCFQDGRNLEIQYENELKPGCEYAVVLPENIKGTLGGTMKSNYVYFSTEYTSGTVVEGITETFDSGAGNGVGFPVKTSTAVGNSGAEIVPDGGKDGTAGIMLKSPVSKADPGKTVEGDIWFGCNGFNIPQAAAADVQVLEFDVMPMKSNLMFELRCMRYDNASRPALTFGFTQDGYIAGFWGRGKANLVTASANQKNVVLCVDGEKAAYTSGEWVHLKMEWDIKTKVCRFYVNGQHAVPGGNGENNAETGSGRLEYTSLAPNDHQAWTYLSDMNITAPGEALLTFDNFKSYGIKKDIGVSKVRFNEVGGKSVGPDDKVSSVLDDVRVYFTDNVDESLLVSGSTVILTYDGVPVNSSITYDSNEKCAVIKPSVIPKSGNEISVEITGISGACSVVPYKCHATAKDAESIVTAANLSFSREDGSAITEITGGNAYVKANIINTTADPCNVTVSAMGYKEGALEQHVSGTVPVAAMSAYELKDTDIAPLDLTDSDAARITVELIEPDGSRRPVTKGFVIGTEAENADDITVSGAAPNAAETEAVIEVYAPAPGNTLVYKTQTTLGKSGEYEVKCNLPDGNDASGMYSVKVYADGYSDDYTVLFTNPSKAENVLEEKLKPAIASGNADSAGDILFTHHYDLFVDNKYIDEQTADKAAALLLSYGNNRLTAENAKTVINKAVAIAALNRGKITNLFSEPKIFDLDNSAVKNVYKADYVTSAAAESISSRLSAAEYDKISDFDDALVNNLVFEIIKNPSRPGSIEEVCKLVGLSGYVSGAYDSISGNTYTTVKAIKDALDKYGSKNSNSQSGGGAGGGKSSIGSSKDAINVPPYTPSVPAESEEVFLDLSGYDWAKDAILKLNARGIVNGTGNKNFEPQRSVKREEFVKMVCGAFGLGTSDTGVGFYDVLSGEWYAPYILRASQLGIIKGVSETQFGVGEQISRQDMAVIIYNALKSKSVNAAPAGARFADDGEIADYAKDAVNALSQYGIINGVGENRFAPLANATRAEVALIIWRCIENFSL